MDGFLRAIVLVALPFCLAVGLFAFALGPIANRLSQFRDTLR